MRCRTCDAALDGPEVQWGRGKHRVCARCGDRTPIVEDPRTTSAPVEIAPPRPVGRKKRRAGAIKIDEGDGAGYRQAPAALELERPARTYMQPIAWIEHVLSFALVASVSS